MVNTDPTRARTRVPIPNRHSCRETHGFALGDVTARNPGRSVRAASSQQQAQGSAQQNKVTRGNAGRNTRKKRGKEGQKRVAPNNER